MTTNLHEMFGLPDKKVDYKARLIAATEHMRSEVKDIFRELGLQEDDLVPAPANGRVQCMGAGGNRDGRRAHRPRRAARRAAKP